MSSCWLRRKTAFCEAACLGLSPLQAAYMLLLVCNWNGLVMDKHPFDAHSLNAISLRRGEEGQFVVSSKQPHPGPATIISGNCTTKRIVWEDTHQHYMASWQWAVGIASRKCVLGITLREFAVGATSLAVWAVWHTGSQQSKQQAGRQALFCQAANCQLHGPHLLFVSSCSRLPAVAKWWDCWLHISSCSAILPHVSARVRAHKNSLSKPAQRRPASPGSCEGCRAHQSWRHQMTRVPRPAVGTAAAGGPAVEAAAAGRGLAAQGWGP